ncbi:hypothetical protein BKA56DRAFT_736682 [Ilyonectria sp. MPI-CAGE-AT-0026]|nr:hypothetical protein BKA56DRAFT_736682 [Ilyonectria sp. MPI-CAGE-AT-0026]
MRQQRITLFFPVVSTKTKNTGPGATRHSQFLSLPFNVRSRIYHEAGLVEGKTIHMNYWATRHRPKARRFAFDHDEDSHLPPLPLDLFPVCRLVNEELTQALYGQNYFAITRRGPRGLRALERFRDSTLRQLRFLVIRVNLASCIDVCCGNYHRRCGNNYVICRLGSDHDSCLDDASAPDQLIIAQWEKVCARLSSVDPGQLALFVICDSANLQTAVKVVEPMLALPPLREFALRLARDYDRDIQLLAKETVSHLTAPPPPPQKGPPFRFLHLPKEIQLKILKYTRLTTGFEVTCTQKHMRYGGLCSVRGLPTRATPEDDRIVKCFCCRGHSAFNMRCDHCETIGFPHALFLVNRQFRDAAIEILYSSHSFIVEMVGCVPETTEPTAGDFSIVPGLTVFPRYAIRLFTSLVLSFEPSNLALLQSGRTEWKYWIETIDLLSEEANLAVLHLEVRTNEDFYRSIWDFPMEEKPGYEDHMWETYQTLIRPMASLRGLKSFFMHINWGSSCGMPGQKSWDGRDEIENKLERMVMGQEYDSWEHGKEVRMDCSYS